MKQYKMPDGPSPVANTLRCALLVAPTADKWCKHHLKNAHGQHCALGMINEADHGNWDHSGLTPIGMVAIKELAEVMRKKFKAMDLFLDEVHPAWTIADINNHELIDYNFIRECFEEAAKNAEAKALSKVTV